MSRVSTLAVAAATGAIAERFSRIKKTAGGFPNVEAAIEALEPDHSERDPGSRIRWRR